MHLIQLIMRILSMWTKTKFGPWLKLNKLDFEILRLWVLMSNWRKIWKLWRILLRNTRCFCLMMMRRKSLSSWMKKSYMIIISKTSGRHNRNSCFLSTRKMVNISRSLLLEPDFLVSRLILKCSKMRIKQKTLRKIQRTLRSLMNQPCTPFLKNKTKIC